MVWNTRLIAATIRSIGRGGRGQVDLERYREPRPFGRDDPPPVDGRLGGGERMANPAGTQVPGFWLFGERWTLGHGVRGRRRS